MKVFGFVLALLGAAGIASAQVSTEVVAPGATVTTPPGSTVTTTVSTPDETTTTRVTSTAVQSRLLKLRDGHRLEIDSDDSAYIVYDDGARINAPDGIHALLGGTNVTVKNGKVIP